MFLGYVPHISEIHKHWFIIIIQCYYPLLLYIPIKMGMWQIHPIFRHTQMVRYPPVNQRFAMENHDV